MQNPSQKIVIVEKQNLQILNENSLRSEYSKDILNKDTKVGPLVAKMPGYASLFEQLGIDYCCKGNRTLGELCTEKNLDIAIVLDKLAKVSEASQTIAWDEAPLKELMRHIVVKHHDYLRGELPRISGLIEKVIAKHGDLHPELLELQKIFERLKTDLIKHLDEEEMVVFPLIKNFIENGNTEALGKLESSINSLDGEHLEAGAALEKMNGLTNGYTPPKGACTTYLVLLSSLAFLEKDMHEHVHKENHILFPSILSGS